MEIKEQIDCARKVPIHSILGLVDKGRRITIKCVFHNDHSPSLVIYPRDGGFHCYACGAHGANSIDFSMGLGYTFKDAVKELQDYI